MGVWRSGRWSGIASDGRIAADFDNDHTAGDNDGNLLPALAPSLCKQCAGAFDTHYTDQPLTHRSSSMTGRRITFRER